MEILAVLFAGTAAMLSLVSKPAPDTGPVVIKSCDVAYIDDSSGGNGIMTTALQYTNGVTVKVMNTSSKAVSNFTVMGSYNDFEVTDTWAGKLPPGAELSIYKHYQQLPYVNSKAVCHVTKVTYDDGTTWSSSAATPAP